ncbi:MAG: molybdate ABC transporter substrate-binding protein [Methanosarcinaceae archaeon]|nr:molybdate ABC transporter substrate-binding protein [Methanosarcinaceae archaeon]MDD4331759.1 molybdate ABC transporter substrate-binding protein [Methanosarcinaceae archaeon]MDD4748767.1 molybdate ABC transporter substrate-binding protein [Methanosarcinaceae archaeon]
MKKLYAFTLIFLLLLTAASSGCADKTASDPVSESPAQAFEGKTLSVCSGAGLIKPMNELVSEFENETGAEIQLHYGGSAEIFGILAAQECDVFIPGAYYYTEAAMGKHYLLNESVKNVTLHVPIIAVPKGNPGNIKELKDFATPGVKLALGDPKGPAIGKVAKKICETCGILPEVEQNTIVRTTTVNQLLIYIVSEQADATIIWEDMVNWGEANGKLETIPIPAEQNTIKTIPTAVSEYTKEPELAEAFNNYIASEEAAATWEKWGFKPCGA